MMFLVINRSVSERLVRCSIASDSRSIGLWSSRWTLKSTATP